MKKIIIAACLLITSPAFVACDSNTNQNGAAIEGELNAIAGDTVPMDKKEKRLIPEAALASMMQIELGELAIVKGRTEEVRQYGQLMVDTYTTKRQELIDYAESVGVELPQTLTEKQQERVQELSNTRPEKFDMAYWDTTIRAHKDAIDEFNDVMKLRKEQKGKELEANSFELWAINTLKEKYAQLSSAMSYRLELKNRT